MARRRAADEHISVSKLIARILESQMCCGDEYWVAYERWKKLGSSIPGIGAAKRLTREKAHGRRLEAERRGVWRL
jgi:hypothetical protein